MPKKIRLSYDILAMRAIETESGVNIDDALRRIHAYEVVDGTGDNNHPDVRPGKESTKILYIVRTRGELNWKYAEWIWYNDGSVEKWVCVGGTTSPEDSWKLWSEARNSEATGENSVYIGSDNTIDRNDGYAFGSRNTISVTDDKDYSGSEAVSIGRDNVSLNSIDSYNFGHDNEVTGGNPDDVENKLAMNLGAGNQVVREGVNIGKGNASDTFGITIGQRNNSHNAAIVLGENNTANGSSIAMGKRTLEFPINFGYPAMLIDGKYYPIVKSSIPANSWVATEKVGFDCDGNVVNLWDTSSEKTGHIAHINTRTRKVFFVALNTGSPIIDGQFVDGYTDDSGVFHETTVSPDPEQYPIETYYRIVHNGVTFVGTTSYSPDPMDDQDTGNFTSDGRQFAVAVYFNTPDPSLSIDVEYSIDDLISRKLWFTAVYGCGSLLGRTAEEKDTRIWINAGANKASRCTSTISDSIDYAPKDKVLVTGFYRDGVFYPYNGRNNGDAEVIVEPVDVSHISYHRYTKQEHDELGLGSFDELASWIPADGNSIAVGDAQNVHDKSVGISATCARIMAGILASVYTSKYTDLLPTGESEEYQPAPPRDHDHLDAWPSNDTPISVDEVSSGSIGLLTEENISSMTPSHISGGSIGIGNRNTVSKASIAVGSICNAQERSMAFGVDSINASGSSVSVGARGVTTTGGAVALGFGGIGAQDGSLTVGFNGPQSSNGSLMIGMSGGTANNGSIAIGFTGVYATSGSICIGSVGANASNDSFVFGKTSFASDGSVSIGYAVNAYSDSLVFGKRSNANSWGIAVGRECDAYHDSISVGKGNTAGSSSDSNTGSAIALGIGNTSYTGSVTVGRNNTANSDAFAFGESNTVYGWSIGLGVNNVTPNSTGAHATLIGYDNVSNSTTEYLTFTKSYPTLSANIVPLGTNYKYCLSQVIYRQSELGFVDGPITQIAFNVISRPFTRTLSIYMVNTEKSAFSSSTDWVPTTSSDLVYSGTYQFETGWNYITLDTPFTLYQGMNVALVVDDNTGSASTRATNWETLNTETLETGALTAMVVRGDTTDYDVTNLASYTANTRTFFKNTIRFVINGVTVAYPPREMDGQVATNSVIMGVSNEANHYNSILVGVGNISTEPYVIQDGYHYDTSDDDGFMIAIGRENRVGRNYDIAIGYKSVATGGENVSLQHSSATGYRNLSMFDSVVKGTANACLVESKLCIPGHGGGLTEFSSTSHNMLFNSTADHGSVPSNGYMRNVVLDADFITSGESVNENFVFGGAGGHVSPIQISTRYSITGNTILGGQHSNANFIIQGNECVIDNIISRPSSINVSVDRSFTGNILIGQPRLNGEINPLIGVDGQSGTEPVVADTIHKNIVIHGSIQGTAECIGNNLVLSDSLISSSYKGIGISIRNNILLNESRLYNTNATAWWGQTQPASDNILVGSIATDTLACVSIADIRVNQAELNNTLRVFNFGDNSVTNAVEGRVFGGANVIYGAKTFFISGDDNKVSGDASSAGNANGGLSLITLIGSRNRIFNSRSNPSVAGSNDGNDRNTVIGCSNIVNGFSISDNTIFGSDNRLGANSSSSWSGTERYIVNCNVFGSSNVITSNVSGYTIIGKNNQVKDDMWGPSGTPVHSYDCIGCGFVQGNDNVAKDGSNIISMGNGNVSTGHNSVAIGSQLISNQWQTVIGKYNTPIAGPNRLASETPQDATKALFIIGNGYSTTAGNDWQDESNITRSNAMVVYADGTVKASSFVSDDPVLDITAGDGISVTETASNLTISLNNELKQLLVNHPGGDGKRYSIECNNGQLGWVEIGVTSVGA